MRTIAIAGFALACCTGPLAADDLPELKAHGSLRVLATPEEYPDWFSLKAGPDPGFERELLEGFAQLQRLKLEVVLVNSFDLIIPALLEGRGDVIQGIIDTPARRTQIAFTAEVLPSRHLAASLKSQSAPKTLAELRARKVGVVAGTTWADVARANVPAGQITTFARGEDVLKALHTGTVNATVFVLSEFLSTRRVDPEIDAGLFLGPRVSAAWGVRQKDVELRRALDEYLGFKKQSMAWSQLVVKYFGSDARRILNRVDE